MKNKEREKEREKNKIKKKNKINQNIYEDKVFIISSKTTIKTYCINVCIYHREAFNKEASNQFDKFAPSTHTNSFYPFVSQERNATGDTGPYEKPFFLEDHSFNRLV